MPVPVPRGRRSRRVAVVARRHGLASRTGVTDWRHGLASRTGVTDRRHGPAPRTAHLHYRSDRCNEQVGASADPVTRTDQVGTGPGRPGRRCGPVRRDRTSRDRLGPARMPAAGADSVHAFEVASLKIVTLCRYGSFLRWGRDRGRLAGGSSRPVTRQNRKKSQASRSWTRWAPICEETNSDPAGYRPMMSKVVRLTATTESTRRRGVP